VEAPALQQRVLPHGGETGFAMRADFQYTCDPPIARLRIAGELDISTGDQLADVFDCLDFRRCPQVELDLDAVTFIDAYSLAQLRREQLRLRSAHGDLYVVAASPWYTLVSRLAQYDSLQVAAEEVPHLTLLHTRRHLRAQQPG
jgi:anti-anti-sigma factor